MFGALVFLLFGSGKKQPWADSHRQNSEHLTINNDSDEEA